MPLPDGETLLGKTALRALQLPGVDTLVTVTNRDYYFHTKDVYAGLGEREPRDATYLLEPFGRNTAPAVRSTPIATSYDTGGELVSTGAVKQLGACRGVGPRKTLTLANLTANDDSYALAA